MRAGLAPTGEQFTHSFNKIFIKVKLQKRKSPKPLKLPFSDRNELPMYNITLIGDGLIFAFYHSQYPELA